MYSGIGLAVMASSLVVMRRNTDFVFAISKDGLIDAPLILSFFIVSGLRATFNIPYELNSNWIFQITSGWDAAEYLKATRKWVFLRAIVPVYIVITALELFLLDPAEAVFHLAFGLAVAALLTEFFFFRFNKVPFTCSYLPAKSHLAFLAGAYLYGFTIYTFTVREIARWVEVSSTRITCFFVLVAAILIGLALYRRRTRDRTLEIVYEDEGDVLVQQLNLT